MLLKLLGTMVLLGLVYKYRGNEGGQITLFNTWWWGILGLIGWAYLVAALLYAFANGNRVALWAGWLISMAFCMFHHSGLEPQQYFLHPLLGPIGDGAMTMFTIGGALASSYFWSARQLANFTFNRFASYCLLAAAILLAIGFLTRPQWGISKIRATPSWVLICSAITLIAFIIIYWITDLRHHTRWAQLIKPAGTDTLLCYLLPYFVYALVQGFHWSLPEALLTGGVGLLKSLVFALLVTALAGFLARRGIKLKL
jgi:predicted acyltransferase